jgi:hypothetical protein
MESINPVPPRARDILRAEELLREATSLLSPQRDSTPRGDQSGRHLSIAITHIEDALLRIKEATG